MVAHQILVLLVEVLSHGVMVAHQILVLLVEVRILVGQPKTPPPRRFFVPIGIGNLAA